MKRKITGALIIAVLLSTALFQAIPVMADSGELYRVKITPSNVALCAGDEVELTAIAYDSTRDEIDSDDMVFTWYLLDDDIGYIDDNDATCIFEAGDVTGVYEDTIKVKVIQDETTKYAYATVTITGDLDYVTITPSTLTIAVGDTKQFKARAFDDEDVEITTGITYDWDILDDASGTFDGDDDATGQTVEFTAGTETGTFEDAIMVTATQDSTGYDVADNAAVTVRESSSPTPRTVNMQNMFQRFAMFRNFGDFENFLSGEFKIRNGDEIQTIEMIAGVIESYEEDMELVLIPNEDTDTSYTYELTGDTIIMPSGTNLDEGDNVIVIIVDDVVTMVAKTGFDISRQLPPGLNKKNGDARDGKDIPHGWSRGNKTGWSNNSLGNNNQGKAKNK